MPFVNPLMLWGALAASIPIIIYLFNRQRFRTVEFAAMEFLLRAYQKNRRRLRLENLLLLLLRTAIILFAALALARPITGCQSATVLAPEAKKNIILAVDHSYSTQYAVSPSTAVYDHIQEEALRIVDQELQVGDRFLLAWLGRDADFVYPEPVHVDERRRREIREEIQNHEVSDASTNMARSLRSLHEASTRFDLGDVHTPKELIVLTDMQRHAWAEGNHLRDAGLQEFVTRFKDEKVSVTFIDLGLEETKNAAVTGFSTSKPVVGVDLPFKFDITIKNFSPFHPLSVSASLHVDGENKKSESLDLEPGEEHTLTVPHVFHEPGPHTAQVRLEGDKLVPDNVRSLVVDVVENIDVLLVDGNPSPDKWDSEILYLESVLEPRGGGIGRVNLFRRRVVLESELPELDLENHDAIMLVDVAALSDGLIKRLERYVKEGGALIVWLGEQVDAEVYNDTLWNEGKGLLPGRIEELVEKSERGDALNIHSEQFQHPVTQRFNTRDFSIHLLDRRFRRFFAVEADPEAVPLFRLDDADKNPFLLVETFGRGQVALFTSSGGFVNWNNFVAAPVLAMTLDRLIPYLTRATEERRNLAVGENFELIVPSSRYTKQVLISTPPPQQDYPRNLEKIEGDQSRFRLVHTQTEQAGIYDVKFLEKGETGTSELVRTDHFAVNLDPAEGNLEKVAEEELHDLLPELDFTVRSAGGASESVELASGANEWWKHLMGAVLIFLVLETLFAFWIGRRQATT